MTLGVASATLPRRFDLDISVLGHMTAAEGKRGL